jgi:hypothetical protein
MAFITKFYITALSIFISCSTLASDPFTSVDTLLTNGKIYTVDGKISWAEAVAITDGRIVYALIPRRSHSPCQQWRELHHLPAV